MAEHVRTLDARAARLQERAFDAVRFRGGGTDLTVGLARGPAGLGATTTEWGAPMSSTCRRRRCSPRRTSAAWTGRRATRPFQLTSGGSVEGLELRFAAGRRRVRRGDPRRRAGAAPDGDGPGAARLGEVALVDGSSPVGRAGRVFGDVLFDENATCHIAWGGAYTFTVPGLPADEASTRRSASTTPSSTRT